ncbi:hypothetical protein Q3G72_004645 [Acer saccharum]|nr:hypothetical protein Q3G72_004645 [Acer saccharum]
MPSSLDAMVDWLIVNMEELSWKLYHQLEEFRFSKSALMFGKGPNYYVWEQSKVVDSPKIVSVESDVASPGKIIDQGISLCIDLRGHDLVKAGCDKSNEGHSDLEVHSTAVRRKIRRDKKKIGKGFDVGVQSHSMKARRSKIPHQFGTKSRVREVIWNLDEEITKVYEKGAEMGVDFKSRTDQHTDNKRSWVLEEEVRKVIDTGVAQGIDFNGRKAEVMLYLSAREQEDEDNFNE